jgi:hypothetical protein
MGTKTCGINDSRNIMGTGITIDEAYKEEEERERIFIVIIIKIIKPFCDVTRARKKLNSGAVSCNMISIKMDCGLSLVVYLSLLQILYI